jgi:hypothetical protein
VVIDKKDQGFPPLRRQLQSGCHALREDRARFRVGSGAYRLSCVMQEQGEIENKGVFEFLKYCALGNKFGIGRAGELVQLVNAHQSVFIRGVAMEKLLLHQAGELPEFRNVASEKIDAVHHAQNAPDLALT